jgi:D-alanyl-D-alanine carboxypeptidase
MCLRRGTARRARHAVGIFALSLAAILVATQADARSRRHHHASSSKSDDGWREGHASIVVDAKTGKVLQESNADKLRHPASLTKIMTLYLLFEQIDAGRLNLNSKIRMSEHASEAAPTKLGLDPGEKIEVEDAIKAVVTRSANDIAIAIGEALAGSEDAFAARMTKKAHALGMKNTVFTNASGLPDKRQVTTARDMALLGRAIQDRFPKLYRFFSIRTFVWHGSPIGNHNHLLGSVEGVDGIKTGYTRASGFNLVTSVKRKNRFIVAVVLGGRSSRARDAHMRELISDYMPRAYAGVRTAPMLAEAPEPKAPKFVAKLAHVLPPPRPSPIEGSREPIRPLPVRTVQLTRNTEPQPSDIPNSGTLGTLTISPFGDVSAGPPQSLQVAAYSDTRSTGAPGAFTLLEKPKHVETAPVASAPAQEEKPSAVKRVAAATLSSLQLTTPAEAAPAKPVKPEVQKPTFHAALAHPVIPEGWQIQIGAYAGESEAQSRLQAARGKLGSMLAKVTSFTEKTVKGSIEYVRARFAGFHSEADAKKACDALKRKDFDCITVRN